MVTSSLSTIKEHEMKTYGDGKCTSAHSLYSNTSANEDNSFRNHIR